MYHGSMDVKDAPHPMEGTELGYIKPVTHTHTHTYTQAHHFLWRVFHK